MNDNQKFRDEIADLLRTHFTKVSSWITRIWNNPKNDDDYEKSEDYQKAVQFYKDFEQKPDVAYEPVIEYVNRLLERYEDTSKLLDEKADSIIKYLGGGSAIVTFGALASLKAESQISCLIGVVALFCLVPSLVCAALAVHAAINVRKPRGAASLPGADYAVRIAEHYVKKDQVETNLWLSLHPIAEAAYFRNLQKAKQVEMAHLWYRWAMAGLLLPVVGVCISLFCLYFSLPSAPVK